jgi:ketosteroid isomerase-like protein
MLTHKIAASFKPAFSRNDRKTSVAAFSEIALCLFFLLSAAALTAAAQTPAAAPPPNFSGKWAGHFDITAPDGSIQNDAAVLILKQDGAVIAGSAGENEGQQSEIKSGKADGSEIQFTIDSQGAPMIFHLHLDADHLKGDASSGKMSARVDVTRAGATAAQSSSPPALFNEIAHMDSVLFNAYNQRDLEKIKTLFAPDLEFYHDRGGLTRYQENMDSFKKTFEGPALMRRELAEGTLEVYPLKGYGAVEIGIHRFYTTDPGQKERLTATAKFIHVWQQKDGEWKLARVISYDHH